MRPTKIELKRASLLLEPVRRLFRPHFVGLENIPEQGRAMLVGNHTLGGVYDVPFFYLEVAKQRGRILHALGDHVHWKFPIWRKLIEKFGAVDGNRANCAKLMKNEHAILVYPGGAREVAKVKGEEYQLVWGKRLGFVRMAITHNCPIIPFASYGIEHALDIVYDREDLLSSKLGELVRKVGVREDLMMPILKGIGPTPIPRPERLYFWAGEPIIPADFGNDPRDDDVCLALREAVRTSIESGLDELKALREANPEGDLLKRLKKEVLGE